MPGANDAMLARLQSELEDRRRFQDQLVESAQEQSRDLSAQEMELYQRAQGRMVELEGQLLPLRESLRIASESSKRSSELQHAFEVARDPARSAPVEYRTAGEYILDHWRGSLGHEDARNRLELYTRAAAHQLSSDNLGVIPEPVVGSVLNFIDAARPIVTALGPRPAPGGRFIRPKVTQHTDVAVQSTEKSELVSQKMTITEVNVAMATYGGYVNVSRQNIDWSMPQILDIVVNDLAAQYAIETEGVTAVAATAGATAQTPVITAASTAAEVNAAIWKAAGAVYTATQGVGGLLLAVAPDMMGAIGPLFPGVNPTNAVSTGFNAGSSFGNGPQGSISGITVVMSNGMAAGKAIMIGTGGVEVYEQRIGSLQVTEPSVLGVQIAYAGYFKPVIVLTGSIIKLTA